MKKEVLIIGGGGHARSVIDSLRAKDNINILGILDKVDRVGENVEGIPIIGTDDELGKYYKKGVKYIVMGIGSVGIPKVKLRLYEQIKNIGYELLNVIDDTAVVSYNASIGEGAYIGKGVIINTGVQVGKCCIINTGSIIEHDCKIEDFVHVAPGVTLCGEVKIGKMTHVGAGTTIMQQKRIGAASIIGLGSVVVTDISESKKAYGNPCREVCTIE